MPNDDEIKYGQEPNRTEPRPPRPDGDDDDDDGGEDPANGSWTSGG